MKHHHLIMNICSQPNWSTATPSPSLFKALGKTGAMAAALLAMQFGTASAQTLQMKFDFEGTGSTATDSVAGVTLNLEDYAGTLTNLHGASGSGIGGTGQALDFSAAGQNGDLASAVGSSAISFGTVSNFTVTMWVKPVGDNYYPRMFILGPNGTSDVSGSESLSWLRRNGGTQIETHTDGSPGGTTDCAIPVGQWTFFAYTYDGTNLVSVYSASETTSVGAPASTQSIGAHEMVMGSTFSLMVGNRLNKQRGFGGYIDDVRFYTGLADTNFLEGVRQAAFPNPIITANPEDVVVEPGQTATFSVSATTYFPPLGYKWYVISGGTTNMVTGSPYSGATTATLSVTNATVGLTGNQYFCEVTSGYPGINYSIAAMLTVYPSKDLAWRASPANFNWDFSSTNWLANGSSNVAFANFDNVTFNASGDDSSPISLVVTALSKTINVTGGDYTLTGAGKLSGIGGVTNSGGALTLQTTNDYSGGTLVNGGTLSLAAPQSTTGDTVLSSGQLNINHAGALGSGALTISGGSLGNTSGGAVGVTPAVSQSWNGDFSFVGTTNLNLGSGAVTLSANRQVTVTTSSLQVDGLIDDGGNAYSLTKTGDGTMVLNNRETYTGGTVVNGGTLALDAGGGTANVQGEITVNSGATLDLTASDALGYSAGVQVTAVNLIGGTMNDSAGNEGFRTAFNLTGGTITSSGGTYQMNGADAPINSYASNVTSIISANMSHRGNGTLPIAVEDGTVSSGIDLEISGSINNGGGNVVSKGGAGTLLLSNPGNNGIGGDFTISDGLVILGENGRLNFGNYTATLKLTGGSLQYQGTNAQGLGAIQGTGTLYQDGPGVLSVGGAVNTYSGTAMVASNATLGFTGTSQTMGGSILLPSTATLDVSTATGFTLNNSVTGEGTVTGSVATASPAALIPATDGTVGTLTITSNLDMSAGGAAYFDVSASAGSGNDQIPVGGDLSVSSASVIHVHALSGSTALDAADYPLMPVSGSINVASSPALVWEGTKPSNYQHYQVTAVGTNLVLQYLSAAVPVITATADDATLTRNQTTTITATVTPGDGAISSVDADLSALGGPADLVLVFSNTVAGDNIYTNSYTIAPAYSDLGSGKLVPVSVADSNYTNAATPLDYSVDVANQVWNGAGPDTNWSTNPNWVSGAGPGYTNDSVTFGASSVLTPNMNHDYTVTGLSFDGATGSYNIGSDTGSTLTLTGDVSNNSSFAQALNVPINLSGARTVNAAAGDLTLAGAVTEDSTFTKDGASNLTVSASMTTTGDSALINGSETVSGNWNTGGQHYVGVSGGTNECNVVTGGTVTSGSYLVVGINDNSVGTLDINGGTVIKSSANNNVITVGASGAGTVGTVNLNSGVLTNASTGDTYIGESATGYYNQTGGDAYLNRLSIAQNDNSVGAANISGGNLTLSGNSYLDVAYNGDGSLTASGGAVINANHLTLIRSSGSQNGSITNNGATINTGIGDGNGITIIDNGGGNAYFEMNSGALNVWNNGPMRFAWHQSGTGTFVQNNGDVTFYSDGGVTPGGTGAIQLSRGGSGTYSYTLNDGNLTVPLIDKPSGNGTGTFNQNGGTLTVGEMHDAFTLNLNGGTLVPLASSANWIHDLTAANVLTNGVIIDTAGYDVTIPQALADDGSATSGGLTKVGAGTLTLGAGNSYYGPTLLEGGTLAIASGVFSYSGDLMVSNAVLSVDGGGGYTTIYNNGYSFDGTCDLDINYGIVSVSPVQPVLYSYNGLTNSGTVTINIDGIGLDAGVQQLIYFTSGSATTNGFVLGSLPVGVIAVLTNDTPNTLDLLITTATKSLVWAGQVGDYFTIETNWDIGISTNWYNPLSSEYGRAYHEYSGIGDNVTFDDNGISYAPDVYLTTELHPATLTIANFSGTYNFLGDGSIGGSEALVKTNSGTLFLGTTNSYTGGTIIGGGVLAVTNDAALGDSSMPVTLVGGTLRFDGDMTDARAIDMQADSAIGATNGATATLSSDIASAYNLTMSGGGNLTLSGNLTNASMVIDGYDLSGNYGTLTLSGNVQTTSGTYYDYQGTNVISGSLTVGNNRPIRIGANSSTGGNGTMNVESGGSVTVNNNWISVGTTGGNGTLNVNGGTVNVFNGTIELSASGGGDGTVNVNNGTVNVPNGTVRVGTVSTGTLNLNGGTLAAQNVTQIAGAGSGTVNFNGGILQAVMDNSSFMEGVDAAYVTTNDAVIDSSTYNITIAQVLQDDLVSGPGGLVKFGAGALTMTGSNTFSGPILVSQGSLILTPAHQGANAVTVTDDATFGTVEGSSLTMGDVTLSNSSVQIQLTRGVAPSSAPLYVGALNLNGTTTLRLAGIIPAGGPYPVIHYTSLAGTGGFDPTVTGPQGLVATLSTNAGAQTIEVTVTDAGGIVWDGTNPDVALTNVWDLNSTTNWLVGGSTPTDYQETTPPGDSVTFNDVGTGTVLLSNTASPAVVTINNTAVPYTFSGTGHISGSTGLTKEGTNSATISLSGNDYTGATTVNDGTLNVAGGVLPPSGDVVMGTNAGALLNITSAATIGSLSGGTNTGGNVTFPSGALHFGGNNVATTFGGSLTSDTQELFKDGTNSFDVTGTVSVGQLTWNDGTCTVYGSVFAGENGGALRINFGSGVLNVETNGLVLANKSFSIGTGSSVTAELNVNGGTVVHQGSGGYDLYVPNNTSGNTGTVNLYSGSVSNLAGNIRLGYGGTSAGHWNQTGGTAYSGSTVIVGNSDVQSTYTQSGGTNTFNNVTVGNGGAAEDLFNMSGGSITAANLYVGNGNTIGTATVSGGTISLSSSLQVGHGTSSSSTGAGTLTITNATIGSAGDVYIGYDGSTEIGTVNVQTGAVLNVGTTSEKWLHMKRWNNAQAVLNVDGGTVNLNANTDIRCGTGNGTGAATVNLNSGAITGYSGNQTGAPASSVVDLNYGLTGLTSTFNLNGGTLSVNQIIRSHTTAGSTNVFNFNGGTLQAPASSTSFFASGVATAANVLTGGAVIDTAGFDVTIGQALINDGIDEDGGLTKNGDGTLLLNGVNTYTNSTTVSAGTLGGAGVISGPVSLTSSATLAPGGAVDAIGTLTISNNLSFNGDLAVDVNTGVSPSNDLCVVTGTATYGGSGTLNVDNLGAALHIGDTFQLFSHAVSGGGGLTISDGGAGYTWANHLATDGTIAVTGLPIPTTPTNITFGVSGSTLTLSWPSNYTGWSLQAQTNVLGVGLVTNGWTTLGYEGTNSVTFTIDKANPTVFYRLMYTP